MSRHARCLTVSEVNTYISNLLEQDFKLANLWIKGEITNYRESISGHKYFSLKDAHTSIKCVIFKSNLHNLNFTFENGIEVILSGYLTLYQKDGQYQVNVREIHPLGLGELQYNFENLKKKLYSEGYFNTERKRKIPILPSKIGIITSLKGSVLYDMLTIIKKRFENVDLLIIPTLVQGIKAKDNVVKSIEMANDYGNLDLIVLARGGGSLEELWTFNTEEVVKAIYTSKIPVVSAIGHETDFTLADLVADLRMPTPSAAAEKIVPNYLSLVEKLSLSKKRLLNAMLTTVNNKNLELKYLAQRKVLRDKEEMLLKYQDKVNLCAKELFLAVHRDLDAKKGLLSNHAQRLNALSPLNILARGYAICSNKEKEIIMSYEQVEENEEIDIKLLKGSCTCNVITTRRD